jgi:hypothetical protein
VNGRLGVALALVLLALAAGCGTFLASYWEDVKRARPSTGREPDEEQPPAEHVHFLGIRASDEVAPFQLGVKLLHVFGASPAARAGLEPGDELRTLDGKPVLTASDVKDVLAATQGERETETVPIVYVREGQVYSGTVDLVTRRAYEVARRERLFEEAAYEESAFPFCFRYVARDLTPSFLFLYYGMTVQEPVTIYRELTLFPLIEGVAAFRRESFPLVDSSRTHISHLPIYWTTTGEDRTMDLHDLIPPPPAGTKEL